MMKTKKSYQTQRSKTEKTGKQIYGGKKNNGTGKKQLSAIKENHKKTNTGKKQCFLQHLEKHENSSEVCTDRSKKVVFAAVVLNSNKKESLHTQSRNFSRNL